MDSITYVESWAEQARAKLRNGGLAEADLDALVTALRSWSPRHQRLLYLQATTPSIRSQVIGMALHEPVAGSVTEVNGDSSWPYVTVHAAILDGWQVIHFPQQRLPIDDREIDVLGFEFILQKMEEVSHG
jgi:hypothetical protein